MRESNAEAHAPPGTAPASSTTGRNDLVIGVLALQGDFHAHGKRLEELGIPWRRVREPADLAGAAGVILPGGESTTLLRLLATSGLDKALVEYWRDGGALFGTCAGLIILARKVLNPPQPSLEILDVTVQRNAYGRQIDSFEARGLWAPPGLSEPVDIEMVFIRAPRIVEVGQDAQPIAWHGDEVVAVQQGRVLGATFHPELGMESVVHEYFARLCLVEPSVAVRAQEAR